MTEPDSRVDTSEAEYRKLANALPQIVWTCAANGTLEWVNDHWIALTGLDLEQSLHKGALHAVHPDDREALGQKFGQALAAGSTCEMAYRVLTVHGEYRLHLCRVAPVHDDNGVITRWVAGAFDVSGRQQAEEALRLSELRFTTVFHLNPHAVTITCLRDGTLIDVNDAFLRLTELTREEAIGRTTVELGFVTHDRREQRLAGLAVGGVAEFIVEWTTASGRALRLIIRCARIETNGEDCLVNVVTDITDQLLAEEVLRRSEALARSRADELATLMDAVPAVVLISHDTECRVLRGNRTGRELLRSDPGANLSKSIDDRVATGHFRVFEGDVEMAPIDLPLQRAARGIEVRNHDERIVFDDGAAIHLYGNAVPLLDPDGRPRGAIGAFVDVTRLKNAEAALREADRLKDDFIALLSHELRNPLAAIVGAAEIMNSDGDPATAREREVILHQSRHLVRLVEDLLDVSRVAHGKLTLQKRPVELASIVQRAIELARPLIDARQHQMVVRVAPRGLTIDADEVRLTQVLSNLVMNAARYTPGAGLIEVSATRAGATIELSIRDNGIGIDEQLLPQLFEKFKQGAHQAEFSGGGLGLGLALAQSLTRLHGGSITARSDGPGYGSEFIVHLPAADAVNAEPARSAPYTGAQTNAAETDTSHAHARSRRSRILARQPRRVLVVDDNQDGAEMLQLLLTAAGHDVRTANDPRRALAVADTFLPQLAILDIAMPAMDGYMLADEMRARLGSAVPVFIALTGYGSDEDRVRSETAGFALHLVKPVDAHTLVQSLDGLDIAQAAPLT